MAGDSVNIGNLQARLSIDKTDFDKGIDSVDNDLSGLGASFGSFSTIAVAGLAAVGAAFAALGYAAYNAWTEIDAAFDNIRVGTGETGETLAGLQDSFKNVFANVPADAADVSDAIADLNTRLGLTGKPLEDLTTQILELSRLTGTSVKTNVRELTRLFNDFGVSAEDQADKIDLLFRASQKSGISVDRLASLTTQFGASLRGMGFNLETSVGMLAKFEKEGVNTEQIMSSLRIAVGNMAEQGITDANEALDELFKRIKNAPDLISATGEATAIFGSRAAATMADAIRNGRFEFEEFLKSVVDGQDTVLQAAEDTRDLGESFTILQNKITLALEPLGNAIAQTIDDNVIPALDTFVSFWGTEGNKTIDAIGGGFDWLIERLQPLANLWIGFWGEQAAKLTEFWEEDGELIQKAINNIIAAIQFLIDTWIAGWEYLYPYLSTILGDFISVVLDIVGVFAALLAGDWEALGDKLLDLSLSFFDLAYDAFEIGFNALLALGTIFANALAGIVADIINAIVDIIEDGLNSIIDMINSVISTANGILGTEFELMGRVNFADIQAPTFETPTLSAITGMTVKPSQAVKTALAAAQESSGTTVNQNITINAPEPSTAAETAREYKRAGYELGAKIAGA